MTNIILCFEQVDKSYHTGAEPVSVLTKFDLQLEEGETLALVGPSGSGKSTILGLSAGLETVTSGRITLLGNELSSLVEEERTFVRRKNTGFIFQTFELIPSLTALENVMVPAELLGSETAEEDAKKLLEEVGLGHRLDHLPSQLSGGERQRTAIARAFINRPKVLFADEPTGNLDRENSAQVAELLFTLNKNSGTTLLMATHDLTLAEQCGRKVELS